MELNYYLDFYVYWFIFSICLVTLLYLISYIFSVKKKEEEKLTAYECGFDSFENSRMKFDIHFFIVAILFLLFDLEIVFFFPFIVNIKGLLIFSFFNFLMFFFILLIGFIYEWKKGALIWIK
jgi:NADH-quinone oxidoreductase subunit A